MAETILAITYLIGTGLFGALSIISLTSQEYGIFAVCAIILFVLVASIKIESNKHIKMKQKGGDGSIQTQIGGIEE